jgi:hypothetical protein
MRRLLIQWMVIGGIVGCAAGCVTSGGRSSQRGDDESGERRVPPEVTDHTVDDRSETARSHRPRVEVSLDRGELIGIEVDGYETSVRRGAQQCYSQSIRGNTAVESEGAVVYEVLVTRSGYVAGTEIMSTGLRNDSIQSCVERVISRLRFDIPVRNRPVFRLFFRLDFYLESVVPSEPPV